MNTPTYRTILQKNGLSATRARETVFAALNASTSPLTMTELVKNCSNIDRVSVYRIIDTFEKIGVVHRVQLGWKYKLELSDVFRKHHHHLTCLICGSVTEFDEPNMLDRQLRSIAQQNLFTLQQHTLELRGTCSRCQK